MFSKIRKPEDIYLPIKDVFVQFLIDLQEAN